MKPGYKQTDVGVIPEEWEVKCLREVLSRLANGAVYQPSNSLGLPVTRIETIADGTIDLTRVGNAIRTPELEDYRMRQGDILFSHINSVDHIGKVAIYSGEPPLYHGMNLLLLRVGSLLESLFLFYWLGSRQGRKKAVTLARQAVSQASINTSDLKRVEIPLPPLPEQRAIATALSDVDGLLGGLDRLIAKKRDLKQAAMQQLLTGQTRLPGFHGEWEVKRLGELGATFGGLTGKTKDDFGEGSAHYITFMNIMTNVVIDCGTFEPVKVSPSESQNRAMKGDLFFNGSSETPEEVAMCAVLLEDVDEVYLNSFCFGFRFRDGAEADRLFLAYYLRSKEGRELMKSLAQGSTRYNLSKVALLKSPLRLPRLPEQTAIAEVLTDMDAELAALEQRREKTRALKQAMMQELLTGRTRLA